MATNTVLQHNAPVMSAQGLFHELDIYEDHLVIRRTDIISRLFGRDEIISLNDITHVHAYKSLFKFDNWSQLVLICKNGRSRALSYGAQQQHLAQRVKDTIEDLISRREVVPALHSL
ncbi:MAG: hypothetical protein GC179_22385 [Anaerolineaceae bacterium]|nr:hypothetical protein [Anaerolineaceae bacterium]